MIVLHFLEISYLNFLEISYLNFLEIAADEMKVLHFFFTVSYVYFVCFFFFFFPLIKNKNPREGQLALLQ